MANVETKNVRSDRPRKRCFVTIGATAPFNSLIKNVLDPNFLLALHEAGYTEVRVQYGKQGKKSYEDTLWIMEPNGILGKYGLTVSGFDFNTSGLTEEMMAARGDAINGLTKGTSGVIVSHAGSGSILDALRIGVPLLVVPNSDLMNNHQIELAEALEQENYVVHGKLDALAASIPQVEILRSQQKVWPPITSKDRRVGGLGSIIKQEMGWLD